MSLKMNMDKIKGEWKMMKGAIRAKWGKLTEDEVEEIRGSLDKLVGKLQQTYGYAKEKAEQEYKDFKKLMTKLIEPVGEDKNPQGSKRVHTHPRANVKKMPSKTQDKHKSM